MIAFATCKIFNKEIQAKIVAFKAKNDLIKSMGFSDDNELNTEYKGTRSDAHEKQNFKEFEEYQRMTHRDSGIPLKTSRRTRDKSKISTLPHSQT